MDSQKSGQNCNSPPVSNSDTDSAGCGCTTDISVHITPTTGGNFILRIDSQTSVDDLKKLVSKKLKVHKERICLLYREKQLKEGSLYENGLVDGSRLTLLPSVETGLLTQKPELSVMQALESLNDTQVNDFLSGKAPLNLTMRLGDHMMLIQLQLSTVPAGSNASTTGMNRSHPKMGTRESNQQVLLSSLASALTVAKEETSNKATSSSTMNQNLHPRPEEKTSPIQSLSDLASRPTIAAPTSARTTRPKSEAATPNEDPISAGLTSCLCRNFSPHFSCPSDSSDSSSAAVPGAARHPSTRSNATARSSSSRTATSSSPGSTTNLDRGALAQASCNLTRTLRQLSSEILNSREIEQRSQGAIIESMQHHGRGVYTGVFSGTLNPALQDRRGRPRRDISTIVHILNDLLCAAPAVRRVQGSRPSASVTKSACECATCSRRCAYGECEGHYGQCLNATSTPNVPESLDLFRDVTAEENLRTRDKIEQLRLVMSECRERRRLRKLKLEPYSIPTAVEMSSNADVNSIFRPYRTEMPFRSESHVEID